jgi:hypothetical protein
LVSWVIPAHCRFFAGRQEKIELKIEPKLQAVDAPLSSPFGFLAEPATDSGVALHRRFRA